MRGAALLNCCIIRGVPSEVQYKTKGWIGDKGLDISDWRIEMDRIDERLVELLNRRANCAIEIGRLKHEQGLPIYSASREAQVLEHVAGASAGPLQTDAIRRLFERIIDESRRIERVTVEAELGDGPGSKSSTCKA